MYADGIDTTPLLESGGASAELDVTIDDAVLAGLVAADKAASPCGGLVNQRRVFAILQACSLLCARFSVDLCALTRVRTI